MLSVNVVVMIMVVKMSFQTDTDNHIHSAKQKVAEALNELSQALFGQHTEISDYTDEYRLKCQEALKLLMDTSKLL